MVTPIERIIRGLSAEHAATLEDIRAEVPTPDRLNTLVFGGFAAVALGDCDCRSGRLLAFSVSGRTREFGIRLAVGGEPRQLVVSVMSQGAAIAAAGVIAGAASAFALARLAGSYFQVVRMPGAIPMIASAAVLVAAALVASMLTAARAARVDVIQALRSE